MDTIAPAICLSEPVQTAKGGISRTLNGVTYWLNAKRGMWFAQVGRKGRILHRDLYALRYGVELDSKTEIVPIGSWDDFAAENWILRPKCKGRKQKRIHPFVVFNGKNYCLEPDTGYYCSKYPEQQRLHRAVWEYHNGSIPDGFDVHHKDENKENNDISNFELLTRGDHMRLHGLSNPWIVGGGSSNVLRRTDVQRKAADWHASPEGRAWHSQNGKQAMAKRPVTDCACEVCGGIYKTKWPTRSRFCSTLCKMRKRQGYTNETETRECRVCTGKFTVPKNKIQLYCDSICKGIYADRLKKQRRENGGSNPPSATAPAL